MSASALDADPSCARCGATLPQDARFCPACGAPAEAGATRRLELPPDETGPVPVSVSRTDARMFGVSPPRLLLGVALVAIGLAIVLFAAGHWPYGLIVLGVGALLLAAFLEAARRRPAARAAHTSSDVRERAASLWETLRTRAATTAGVRRIQAELSALAAERRTALLRLGEAAYGGDSTAEARVRAHLAGLDAREAGLQSELDRLLRAAGERIYRARLPVQDTVMVAPNEPGEPYPPPGEATPPRPAIVPEPYPPPDEGTPPAPAPDPGRPDGDDRQAG